MNDGAGNVTSFGYDADGNLSTEHYANADVATYAYDNADRVINITDATAAGTPFLVLPYSYDASNLVTSDNPTGQASAPTRTLGYDPRSRLTSAQVAATGNGYTYDGADNIATQSTNAGTTHFTHDLAEQLTGVATTSGGTTTGSATLGYDPEGNRTSETDSLGNHISITYNQANELASYKGPAVTAINGALSQTQTQATYAYDADGLRTDLLWNRTGPLPLVLEDSNKSAYLTGPDGLPVEQITSGGTAFFFHHDVVGSTRALTSSAGAVAVTYTYDPYGRATASTTTIANPFTFAGQYQDANTGLIYMRARWYDPTTGTFLQRDPLVGATLAPYAYVGDQPITRADPSGMCYPGDGGDGPEYGPPVPSGPELIRELGLKKVSTRYLEERGIDPHEVKGEVLGFRANLKHYDIYKSRDGRLFVMRKSGKGAPQEPIETGYSIRSTRTGETVSDDGERWQIPEWRLEIDELFGEEGGFGEDA